MASKDEKTDKGTDLLEQSTLLSTPFVAPSVEGAAPSHTGEDPLDETLKDATILAQEGLLEDAKKRVRQALHENPGWIRGREFLEHIHERELEDILKRQSLERISDRSSNSKMAAVPASELLLHLDQDLELKMDLWNEGAKRDVWASSILNHLRDVPPKELIDLGIAFFEMGWADVSTQLLQKAHDSALAQSEPDDRLVQSALLLKAQFSLGTPQWDSVLNELQAAWIRNPFNEDERVSCAYLLAQGYERMPHAVEAQRWYQEVVRRNPGFRDAAECLQRLREVR